MRSLLVALLVSLTLSVGAQEAVRLDETTTGYQIRMRYPKLAVPEEFAKKQVADFKKEFQETTGGKPYRVPFTLDLDYTLPWQNQRLQAVYLVGSSYTGGAHPNPFLASFILDRQTGRAVKLDELFTGDYLGALAHYCRGELGKREISSETSWIATGTAPQAANYSVAYPTEQGLLVIFPPYQVAPYVAGPQEVLVPAKILAPFRAPGDYLDWSAR